MKDIKLINRDNFINFVTAELNFYSEEKKILDDKLKYLLPKDGLEILGIAELQIAHAINLGKTRAYLKILEALVNTPYVIS